jgi:hypothetical protein
VYGELNVPVPALEEFPRVVHKFRVPIDGEWHRVDLPQGATLVHVGNAMIDTNRAYLTHERALHFWAEVPAEPKYRVHREFRVYGTGQPILERRAVWAGTFIEGGFVWHMYMLAQDD